MQATIAKSADYDEIAWQLQALYNSEVLIGSRRNRKYNEIHTIGCF